jgi:transcriptional regulator with XRE-family HTH domain
MFVRVGHIGGSDEGTGRVVEGKASAEFAFTSAERWFGERVQALRKARGWTQEDLARQMGNYGFPMHQVTVGKIENAGRPTPVGEVVALAAIFDVEPHDLFRHPLNYANAAAAERALLALQAKKAELKAVNEQIEVLVRERGRLKRERGQLHQQFLAARKAENAVVWDSASEASDGVDQ